MLARVCIAGVLGGMLAYDYGVTNALTVILVIALFRL